MDLAAKKHEIYLQTKQKINKCAVISFVLQEVRTNMKRFYYYSQLAKKSLKKTEKKN